MNSYAILALFRVISVAQDEFNQYADQFAEAIAEYVEKAEKDVTTTAYSIYVLFETIGYIVFNLYSYDKQAIKIYNEKLNPKLHKII